MKQKDATGSKMWKANNIDEHSL